MTRYDKIEGKKTRSDSSLNTTELIGTFNTPHYKSFIPSSMDNNIIIISFCRFINSLSNSSCSGSLDSLSCMWAKMKRNPPTASQRRLWAKVNWLPWQGPCSRRKHYIDCDTSYIELINKHNFMKSCVSADYSISSIYLIGWYVNTDLDVLRKSSKHLLAHFNSSNEVELSSIVNGFLARIVPIEVHHRLLDTQQVVYCAND